MLTMAGMIGALGCSRSLPADDPRMIAEWMQNYYGLIRAERVSPPVASRLMAYAAVALYEGLAVATPSLRSLAGQLNGLDSVPRPEAGKRYDATLTAIAAERTVLDTLFREGTSRDPRRARRAHRFPVGGTFGSCRFRRR